MLTGMNGIIKRCGRVVDNHEVRHWRGGAGDIFNLVYGFVVVVVGVGVIN